MTDAKPVTILMIEDDDGHARLIEKNIRRAGVNNEIIPFVNGTDALAYLFGQDGSGTVSTNRHYLILLDLNLPDMTGVSILEKVKANPHTKRTPVVVLTTTAATISGPMSTSPSRSITTALPTLSASWACSFRSCRSRRPRNADAQQTRQNSLCR